MNDDSRKRSGIKHYQNSDYPSGSLEAAIQADREAELRSSAHLRLERRSPESSDDIAEMVPDFMHRDFFRSEEDAIDAVNPSSRLRLAKTARKGPLMVPRTPDSALPDPVAGYVAPPMTEDVAGEAGPKVAPSAAKIDPPLRAEKPLAPLRAAESTVSAPARPSAPPGDGASTPPAMTPLASDRPDASGPKVAEVSPSAPSGSPKASTYSIPLVAALLLVMGLFMWREQTRPEIVPQEALAVPTTIPVAQVAPTPDSTAFRPTFLAVGPPVPSPTELVTSEPDPSDEISPGLEGNAEAPDKSTTGDESDQRAAILEKMNQSSGDADAEAFALPVSEPSEELPWEPETSNGPVREVPSPATVRPSTPSAPVKVPAKPAVKKAPTATAADLFPIDEELPLNNPVIKAPKPAAARPLPVQPVAAPPVALPVNPDGYQIAEPNL